MKSTDIQEVTLRVTANGIEATTFNMHGPVRTWTYQCGADSVQELVAEFRRLYRCQPRVQITVI